MDKIKFVEIHVTDEFTEVGIQAALSSVDSLVLTWILGGLLTVGDDGERYCMVPID